MKASWKIFLYDMKNIGTNWVVAVLIGGLILLPSLYAWFNIKASWDPYSQTNQIPIGVVNEDKGAVVRDEAIHVGDEIVDTLHKNKSMDWQFVNREKAMDKLKYGDYFAVIIIPENLSERLGTVISNQPEKAKVEYYVNEKINAIAPKITEKGASVIVQQISSNFIATVNGIIFNIFNDIGVELEENLPDIEKFEDYIFVLDEKLPEIQEILNQTSTDADYANSLIEKAQGVIPEVEKATATGLQTIDNTKQFLQKAEDHLDEIAPTIKEELEKVQNMIKQTNAFVNSIDATTIDLTKGNQLSHSVNGQIDDMLKSTEMIKNALVLLQKENNAKNREASNNQNTINNTLTEVDRLQQNLRDIQKLANSIDAFLKDKQTEVDEVISGIQKRTKTVNEKVSTFVAEYKQSIEPTVRAEVSRAKEILTNARGIVVEVQQTLPEVEKTLSRTKSHLSKGKKMLNSVSGEFPYIRDKVEELADRIRAIQGEADINEIIQLLQNDPKAEKGFFAEPVVLSENSVFPIPNYGTGMTPFYTVLAIWVGGLLLISLVSTDFSQKETYTERQIYFGRFLTFMVIGLCQALIVTFGDVFLLHVKVNDPLWFVLFGLLCSMIFILIVYTLVSVFGDVGKALAIVILVLQIAGSGGTYPVVLLPRFFQIINPYLPFTYAIDLMREAVGGIVWERVFRDLCFILIFGLLALVLGLFLKEVINKHTEKLKQMAKKSGLFH